MMMSVSEVFLYFEIIYDFTLKKQVANLWAKLSRRSLYQVLISHEFIIIFLYLSLIIT